jgi:hypothetical protein
MPPFPELEKRVLTPHLEALLRDGVTALKSGFAFAWVETLREEHDDGVLGSHPEARRCGAPRLCCLNNSATAYK